jgi:hypothetical protein
MSSALNDQLIEAVTYHRVDEVKRLLVQGANPNYEAPEDPLYPDRIFQPYTPLRMVMFRISDNDLPDDGLRDFAEIARQLIQYGAETKTAMELAELRYGRFDPSGEHDLFMQVWSVVAIADMHSGA